MYVYKWCSATQQKKKFNVNVRFIRSPNVTPVSHRHTHTICTWRKLYICTMKWQYKKNIGNIYTMVPAFSAHIYCWCTYIVFKTKKKKVWQPIPNAYMLWAIEKWWNMKPIHVGRMFIDHACGIGIKVPILYVHVCLKDLKKTRTMWRKTRRKCGIIIKTENCDPTTWFLMCSIVIFRE